jgi:hypothetical protein
MTAGLALVILSLAVLQVKHLICDFILQTPYQFLNKGKYAHPGGFIHAGLHALGSVIPVLLLTDAAWFVAAIVGVEFMVHYHVDWLKEQINHRLRISYDSALYWTVFGADQFIHQITYLVMVAVLARAADL